ncbi:hypothetical protein KTQ42_20875 [Noviherbaspirillum sp. L7-7A]|uniref:hypothetical protein n=1 Tax=Noviherbaspirillum sp. L7-7A TaxID=2850560 RepID=UPI001C2C69B8|nr:hypothetical protein [Noviherbaspirillum sp. L7-7A]MBV0881740.1 hypothetical protein [Noviherbaspirillum sp. L7-7A]
MPHRTYAGSGSGVSTQHKQSDTATRERALAQVLDKCYRSGEVFEQMRHDRALSDNEKAFHWLLNRQLDLVNACHKRELGTGTQ